MGRLLLCGKEAQIPYEVDELDLRLYTIEELCYYIFHYVPLLDDDFVDDRLVRFIGSELGRTEITEKIRRFYHGPSDTDNTLYMLLSDVGYYTESELSVFQGELSRKRKKSPPERTLDAGKTLMKMQRYQSALRRFTKLTEGRSDGRVTDAMYVKALEYSAACCGRMQAFSGAVWYLERLYGETRSQAVLEKIYDTCVLSGLEPDPVLFSRVPDDTLKTWQERYWSMEAANREETEKDPALLSCMKDPVTAEKELQAYATRCREACRRMLE